MTLRVACVLLVAALSLSLSAQSPAPVALDVVVDGVAPRQTLGPADFKVLEEGQPIAIESVRLIQGGAAGAPLPSVITDENEAAAAASADRLVAIYVDEYHLADDAAFAASRSALAAFVRDDLGPRDLVVVLKPLDSLLSIRLSVDREAAAAIIESAVARQGDYTARSAFEQNFIAGAPARIDAARSQIALSSVSALATHLGRFPAGRKTLIVMSNGFTPGTSAPRGDRVLPGVASITRRANRDRVAVYALRPTPTAPPTRDVAAREPAADEDALSILARQTTGFVVDGGDAVKGGLERIAGEAHKYYLLTLSPAGDAADGRYRPVAVEVARRGVRVRARSGFAIPRPAPPPRPEIPAALRIARRSSPLVRTWFGQSAADGGTTRVDFVWEPAPRVPGLGRPPATPSRIAMTVTAADGTEIFSGETSASNADGLLASIPVPQLSFTTVPGRLLVQMDISDASGRVIDHDVRDLSIAEFTGALAFGTAAVYRARTMPLLRAIADGRAEAAPVAARQFSRAEQLLLRLPIAGAAAADAVVTAALESRFGSALRTVTVTRVSPELVQVELPLAGLASGGYALAFDAVSGDATARSRVEFTVTP